MCGVRITVGRSQLDVPADTGGLSRGDLVEQVRTLNPSATERDISILAGALHRDSPQRAPRPPKESRKFNAPPPPAPPTPPQPLLEVGPSQGGNGTMGDPRERLIVNRSPRTKRERASVTDALVNAVRAVGGI
jgi:hypothetical protein